MAPVVLFQGKKEETDLYQILRIVIALIAICSAVGGFLYTGITWKNKVDNKIQEFKDQQDRMQEDIKWLIRHTPDGDDYLQEHRNKKSDESVDPHRRKAKPEVATE